MIEKVEMYGCRCDHCNETFISFEGYCAWTDKIYASDAAQDEGWHEVNGKWYCPVCFSELFDEDDEGNITRKGNHE